VIKCQRKLDEVEQKDEYAARPEDDVITEVHRERRVDRRLKRAEEARTCGHEVPTPSTPITTKAWTTVIDSMPQPRARTTC